MNHVIPLLSKHEWKMLTWFMINIYTTLNNKIQSSAVIARTTITWFLHMVRQWLRKNMHQTLYSQKTPHSSPLKSFVGIWVKIDRVITEPRCARYKVAGIPSTGERNCVNSNFSHISQWCHMSIIASQVTYSWTVCSTVCVDQITNKS